MGNRTIWTACAIALALIWFGAVLGHSFIATPAKFMAASLQRPVALDVGRATFAVFSRTEWALCALLTLSVLPAIPGRARRSLPLLFVAIAVALALILVVQAMWLLPALGERTDLVIAGKPLQPSVHHAAYSTLEMAKAILLLTFALLGFRQYAAK